MLTAGEIKAGRYRIIRPLGEGAMKRVYLAADQHLSDRPCALAEIPENITQEAQRQIAASAFEREAQMLASLEHPAIPKVYDFFNEGSVHYLVMEYVDGKTLETVLAERQRLPWREAAKLGIQILNTLAYLHRQNPPVLYRDLKPSNVILAPDGRVRMVDFGIARHFNPATTATMVGTQGYAPPEQYKGRNEPRSDLYSFGALMHHTITGRDPALEPPFSFPPVRQLATDCDETFAELIDRCLGYAASSRPASTVEARAQIQATISRKTNTAAPQPAEASAATIILESDAEGNAGLPKDSQSQFCANCGYESQQGARFCNSCGVATSVSPSFSSHPLLGGLGWLLLIVTTLSVIVALTVITEY